mmetsp:Transcript_17903/g.39060  ORF Transcript_17903/g.39060 Transcript_17903/m.39060 type:complete len:112 (+) Transcript_17903:68-403(+)
MICIWAIRNITQNYIQHLRPCMMTPTRRPVFRNNKIRNFIDTCVSGLYRLNEEKQKLEEQNEFEPHSVTEDDFDIIDERIRTKKKLMKSFVQMLIIQQIELQNMLDKHEEK